MDAPSPDLSMVPCSPQVLASPAASTVNPYLLYLADLGGLGSRKTQRSAIGKVARTLWGCDPEVFPWGRLHLAELTAVRTWLAERYRPSSANRTLSGLRRILYFARRLGQISVEDYEATRDVKRVRGSRLSSGRALTSGELLQIFRSFDVRKPLDARNAALVALLYGGGLRRAEACSLDLQDLDEQTGAVRVVGKGNKERLCFLPAGARAAVRAYLRLRGAEPGPLLYSTDHGRELTRRRLSLETVSHAIGTIGQRAGIAKFSPHDLRRSFASDMLSANADTITVQKLLGHSSPTTTARYDKRGDADRALAVERLCVPFADNDNEGQGPTEEGKIVNA